MIEHPVSNDEIGFVECTDASQGVKEKAWLDPCLQCLKIRFERPLLQIDTRESCLVQSGRDFEIAPALEIHERYPPTIQYGGDDPIGNAVEEIVVTQGKRIAEIHDQMKRPSDEHTHYESHDEGCGPPERRQTQV